MSDFTEFTSEQEFVPELIIIGKSRESVQVLDQVLYSLGQKTYGQIVFNDKKKIDKSTSIVYNKRCKMPVLFRERQMSIAFVITLQEYLQYFPLPGMSENHNIGVIVDVSKNNLENCRQLLIGDRYLKIKYIFNADSTDLNQFTEYRLAVNEICICGPISQYSEQDLILLYRHWCTQLFVEYDEFVNFLDNSLHQYGCVVLFRNQHQQDIRMFYIRVDTVNDQFSNKYGVSMLGVTKCKYNRRLWHHHVKIELSKILCHPLAKYILEY